MFLFGSAIWEETVFVLLFILNHRIIIPFGSAICGEAALMLFLDL